MVQLRGMAPLVNTLWPRAGTLARRFRAPHCCMLSPAFSVAAGSTAKTMASGTALAARFQRRSLSTRCSIRGICGTVCLLAPQISSSPNSRRFPSSCHEGVRRFSSGGGRKPDLYRLLGVSPDDSPSAIRSAYLRKAKELHPDANAQCPRRQQKEKLFREVTEAYEVLADQKKRQEYDAQRPTEEPERSYARRETVDDWHVGRDEVGEEFWRQVDQIRREKETAWRTMKSQRRHGSSQRGASANSGVETPQMSSAFALLRALPLLVVPAVLFYGLYKSAMARARQGDRPLPPIVRDELGRAFFIDSYGRQFRVMEFDMLNPNSKPPRL